MEGLEIDEVNQWVCWRVDAERAQENALGWRMLENNEIRGILPFDYFYVDHQICFRYAYRSLQRIEEFFHKSAGDFETLSFLCGEVLAILERGREYLLPEGGYLLQPEWIFWNRRERKVSVCYLPGKDGDIGREYTALIEYLMRYTDHSDERAVSMIYRLYDLLVSDGFVQETLSAYLRGREERGGEKEEKREKEESKIEKIFSPRKEVHGDFEVGKNNHEMRWAYYLKPLLEKKVDGIQRKVLYHRGMMGYPVRQGELVVGRGEDSDLYLPFSVVSRRHAVLICEKDRVYLMDTASTNGTYLNDSKISAYVKTRCSERDIITFANLPYQLCRKESGPVGR